jgi:hypothetical protein
MKNSIDHVHFIHVPKTGGTAIKWTVNQYQKLLMTTGEKCKITCHRHNVSFADIPVGENIFFIARDPIDRFVSAFFYCKQRLLKKNYYRKQLKPFDTPNDLAVALDANHPKNLLAKKIFKRNIHMRHISDWHVSKDYFNSRLNDIRFICFTETLTADFDNLKRLLNIPSEITLPQKSKHANKIGKNIPNEQKIIQEPGLTLLKEWYKQDIEFVALCKEIVASRTS